MKIVPLLQKIESTRSALVGSALSQVLVAISQIIAIPIYLRAWTTVEVAAWLLFISFAALSASIDFGVPGTAANEIIASRSRQRIQEGAWWRSLIRRFCFFICLLTVTMSVILWLTKLVVPFGFLNWSVFFFAVFYLIFNSLLNASLAVLRAYDGNGAATWLGTLGILLEAVIPIILVINGFTLLNTLASIFCVRLCFLMLALRIESIYFQERNPGMALKETPHNLKLFSFARNSLSAFMVPVCMGLLLQTPLLIISARLGALQILTYATTRTLCRLVLQVAFTYPRISLPKFANAHFACNDELQIKITSRYSISIWIFAFGLSVIIFTIGPDVIKYWTRNQVRVDSEFVGVLVFGVLLHTFWFTCLSMLIAVNRHEIAASTLLVSVGIYYIIILKIPMSLMGIAEITLLFEIFMSISMCAILMACGIRPPTPLCMWKAMERFRSG